MEIALYVIIFILLVLVVFLVMRPRKIEIPDIAELEAKLRYALASADSVKEIHDLLEDMPRDVLASITRSQGTRSGKLNELLATLQHFCVRESFLYSSDAQKPFFNIKVTKHLSRDRVHNFFATTNNLEDIAAANT